MGLLKTTIFLVQCVQVDNLCGVFVDCNEQNEWCLLKVPALTVLVNYDTLQQQKYMPNDTILYNNI